MTQPGTLGNLRPRGKDAAVREIEALKAEVARLKALMVPVRSPDFNGTSFNDPGTAGNYYGSDGAVLNNLYLRNGIVGDQALANPAAFGWANADWSGLTFTTANLEKDTTIPVPTGYSRALVMVTSTSGATATSSAIANLYVTCTIQGSGPAFVAHQLPANLAGSATRSFSASLTSLASGGTVTVGAIGNIDTNGTVVAGSCNLHVSAIAVFLR